MNESPELAEARKEIMRKLELIKAKFGIIIEEGVIQSGAQISLTQALSDLKESNREKFENVIGESLDKFFSGDMGEFEKYKEDIYHLASSTPKGRYKLDFEIETYFGPCDTFCISPSLDGLILHMAMED